jgi:hypothetical protein
MLHHAAECGMNQGFRKSFGSFVNCDPPRLIARQQLVRRRRNYSLGGS